jgi:hypothetical protein
MCNRFVQSGREIRPQGTATVLLKGPGGFFELPFEGVFAGPARNESRDYWIRKEGAEPVLVPDVSRFGEKDKVSGQQNWEDVPAGSGLEGLLLPIPPGKDYRLLKIVTQAATAEQFARLGNDRVPILSSTRHLYPQAPESQMSRPRMDIEGAVTPDLFTGQGSTAL